MLQLVPNFGERGKGVGGVSIGNFCVSMKFGFSRIHLTRFHCLNKILSLVLGIVLIPALEYSLN